MSTKANIDIIATDPEVRSELYRLISAHYPSKLIHQYAHEREFFSDQERQESLIALVHDLSVLDIEDMKKFVARIDSRQTYIVLVLTKPDYALVAKAVKAGFDDFIYLSENEQLITARLRMLLHGHVVKNRSVDINFSSSLEMVAALISARIPGASEKAETVSHLSSWLLKNSEKPTAKDLADLEIASRLSYIGRMYLNDQDSRSPVTKDGFANGEIMYQVPQAAKQLLEGHPETKEAAKILYHLYENIDGSGFPGGLKSWEIPISSRILRISVDFSEILHDGRAPEIAVSTIKRESNRVYDNRIVSLLPEYINTYLDSLSPEEHAVHLLRLEPGMEIARDIITNQGIKLLPEGKVLDAHTIQLILSHTKIDPVNGHIYIKS